MAKEYDGYTTTVAVIKTFEAETWPTAFAAAPHVYMMSDTDLKKSGCKNITSTGADISCETLGLRIMLATTGYSAAVTNSHPQRDAGSEAITVAKTYQSFTFNSTFAAAPEVICGHESTVAGGKKCTVKSVTTTGGDIAGEATTDTVHWLAHNA